MPSNPKPSQKQLEEQKKGQEQQERQHKQNQNGDAKQEQDEQKQPPSPIRKDWFVPGLPSAEERIKTLESYLDPKSDEYQREEQHANIRAAIQSYKDGTLPDYSRNGTNFQYGKVIRAEEALGAPWVWTERVIIALFLATGPR